MTGSPQMGEFYIISEDFDEPYHGVELVNVDALRPEGRATIRPEAGGFPPLAEVPRLHETNSGSGLSDFQVGFEGYWLVSERLKRVLEAVDQDAFAFAECELILLDGSPGGTYFLCDVVRSIDAIDDDASVVRIATEGYPRGKFYKLAGGAKLAFKRSVVGDAHVFRSPYNTQLVVCDRVMRDALVEHGFGVIDSGRGMALLDAADY